VIITFFKIYKCEVKIFYGLEIKLVGFLLAAAALPLNAAALVEVKDKVQVRCFFFKCNQ